MIIARTKKGLHSTSARGRKGGQQKDIGKAMKLYDTGIHSLAEIEVMSGVSKATLYRYLQEGKKQKT